MTESAPAPVSAGTWRQVALVMDGKDVAVGRATLLTVTPGGYTVSVHGRVYQTGTSAADTAVSPHRSDVTVATGANAGAAFEQIFRVEGDVMVACAAAPGAPRPTAFASAPGSGWVLSVWVRVPARPPASLTPRAWWTVLAVALVFGTGVAGGIGPGLAPYLGTWGALAVQVAVSGALAGVIARGASGFTAAGAHTRRTLAGYGVLFGVGYSATLGVFDGLRAILEPQHGVLGWALALLAGTAAGLAALGVVGPLLKRAGVGEVGE